MIKWLRQSYKGVSWRNPFINLAFKIIDIPDGIVRKIRGIDYLPKYSIRVRSRGVANQFGGTLFDEQGKFMVGLMEKHANLKPENDVIEIGCGCGCGAIGLSRKLTKGTYCGMDIDVISINSCKKNSSFTGKKFSFEWMNIFSSQYNPEGQFKSSEFVFPYEDESADIVFLTSVFTHMLPKDVEHYMSEISRVLRPGGRLFCTVFLMDHGFEGASIKFPYDYGNYRLHQETIPERAVGYYYSFFEDNFSNLNIKWSKKPVLGNWRTHAADGADEETNFGQDILVFEKELV